MLPGVNSTEAGDGQGQGGGLGGEPEWPVDTESSIIIDGGCPIHHLAHSPSAFQIRLASHHC